MRASIVLLLALVQFVALHAAPAVHSRVASPQPVVASAADALGPPEDIAEGVTLFRIDGELDGAARSIRLLRLDPKQVRLDAALATGEIPGRATVLEIARRTGAIAAVNASFFSPTGDPTGVLKVAGALVSDNRRLRGAVAFVDEPDAVRLIFDRVTARVRLRFRVGSRWRVVTVDGVDTTRGPGRLVLYTPSSGRTTDTTGGLEWTLQGTPMRASRPSADGNSAIPSDGYVLSYGGSQAPASLAGLVSASAVEVRDAVTVPSGTALRDWGRATTIVGGAGLLLRGGLRPASHTVEGVAAAFQTTTHPRTVIARDRRGAIWLITVDGRRPGAIGMSFDDLHRLLGRIDATDALNLDGGGSTTMVVRDEVVNRPSDLTGPRAVSDAILVLPRARRP